MSALNLVAKMLISSVKIGVIQCFGSSKSYNCAFRAVLAAAVATAGR